MTPVMKLNVEEKSFQEELGIIVTLAMLTNSGSRSDLTGEHEKKRLRTRMRDNISERRYKVVQQGRHGRSQPNRTMRRRSHIMQPRPGF